MIGLNEQEIRVLATNIESAQAQGWDRTLELLLATADRDLLVALLLVVLADLDVARQDDE